MTSYDDCDSDMVEALTAAASAGMSNTIIPGITTHAEVMSAAFTLLDRTLRSIRKLQSSEQRFGHAAHVQKALSDMLVDHGHVPS